ncbi:hypothetical protein KC19_VG040600 [Ceratodon purpureus]|uniref:IF140/IFT172/WDR19 TPR domain-containing protein n=1 Tax=Ceratodon purpureus TaxID=3225 RepID=A0A8T0HLT4_CERPU|nr:hypothetical protein KC19_VG040600 [Ceratodon purpureus]
MQSRLWKNLAAICVKTKRTDTTFYCFGQMRDAYGVELIKKSENEPEEDARVAMAAIQLGQIDDAKEPHSKCKRYDLLNQLYQFCCNGRRH